MAVTSSSIYLERVDRMGRPPDEAARLVAWAVEAIVTEEGGLLCHAVVIARELGIPAVVGAADAMTSIADGATVEVDRSRVLSASSDCSPRNRGRPPARRRDLRPRVRGGSPDAVGVPGGVDA